MKPWEFGDLKVSENKKYLQTGSKPFFWLGDTAWLMFSKLTKEEIYLYLKNRKEKGYNVIQISVIHSLKDLDNPKFTGDNKIFIDNNFKKPNEKSEYWNHIEYAIDTASDMGMYVGLLPTWGSFVKDGIINLENGEIYAEFLASRYKDKKNIIWIIGGDVRGDAGLDVFNLLGETFRKLCPDKLLAFHPFGRTSSSYWFNDSKWMDINMYQSGHRRYDQISLGEWDDNSKKEEFYGEDNWKYTNFDLSQENLRPTFDAEPSYEEIPQGLHDGTQPRWYDNDIRRYAYWSVFAGACGHTFGHNSIMQFYRFEEGLGAFSANKSWEDSLHDLGAGQMKHLKDLVETVDYYNGKSNDEILIGGQREKYDRVAIFHSDKFLMAYTYLGDKFSLDLGKINFEKCESYWFDPISGIYSFAGIIQNNKKEFVPPKKHCGHNDWILLLKK